MVPTSARNCRLKFAMLWYPLRVATRVIGWSVESSSRRACATRSFLTMLLKVRPVARLKYLEKVGSDM